MKSTLTTLGFIAALIFLNSCNIEKRVYNPGYHIDWRTNKNQNNSVSEKVGSNQEESTVENQASTDIPDTSQILLTEKTESLVTTPEPEINSKSTLTIPTISQLSKDKNVFASLRKQNSIMAEVTNDKSTTTRADGMAIASMVVGIVSWFTPLGLAVVLALLALIFGAVALGRIKKNPEGLHGKGMAITGIVLGLVGLIIVMIVASMI
jgi:cytoskeletal protein RodZ